MKGGVNVSGIIQTPQVKGASLIIRYCNVPQKIGRINYRLKKIGNHQSKESYDQ